MAYSPKQWRAIKLWLDKNELVAQLSAYPFLRGMDGEGNIVEAHISNLEDSYTAWQEQEKRRKAEERKEANRAKKLEKTK